MNSYFIGQAVELRVEFRDADDALADPTTVTAKVRDPAGTVTALSHSHDDTGLYSASVTVDAPGVWWYRFAGTGDVIAAAEAEFEVAHTRFP